MAAPPPSIEESIYLLLVNDTIYFIPKMLYSEASMAILTLPWLSQKDTLFPIFALVAIRASDPPLFWLIRSYPSTVEEPTLTDSTPPTLLLSLASLLDMLLPSLITNEYSSLSTATPAPSTFIPLMLHPSRASPDSLSLMAYDFSRPGIASSNLYHICINLWSSRLCQSIFVIQA